MPSRSAAQLIDTQPSAADAADEIGTAERSLPEDIAASWLNWQCQMAAGVIRGSLFSVDAVQQLGPVLATWPAKRQVNARLRALGERAASGTRGVALGSQAYGPNDQRVCDMVACPVQAFGRTIAVVSMMITTRSHPQRNAVLQLLQWGSVWIETLIEQRNAVKRDTGRFAMGLFDRVMAAPSTSDAVSEIVTRLCSRYRCERVSLGFLHELKVDLAGTTDQIALGRRARLAHKIELAMEEALDQNQTVRLAQDLTSDQLAVAHRSLSEDTGHSVLCSVPLRGRSGLLGAVLLQRNSNKLFDDDTLASLESVLKLCGPLLELKRREERSVWSISLDRLATFASRLLAGRYRRPVVASSCAMAVLLASAIVQLEYRISAPAVIEGSLQRVLVSPVEGYIKIVHARAGDTVSAEQLVAELDDQSLQLELSSRQSEQRKIETELQSALARRERSEYSILQARFDQVSAELDLIEDKIARLAVRAPFDGVLLSEDLERTPGAPVQVGSPLFEIAPLGSYRVVLEVGDEDIALMDAQRGGQMIVAALPGTALDLGVAGVQPVAIAEAGRNFFRVEAKLTSAPDTLRPGMRGVAKLAAGQRSVLWILTRRLRDRLALWLWQFGW